MEKPVSILVEFAEHLEHPDKPGLLPYQCLQVIDALSWPEMTARAIPMKPGHRRGDVSGRQSPRGVLFEAPPQIAYSFDQTVQLMPYGWNWTKTESQFSIYDEGGKRIGVSTIMRSTMPHGLPNFDVKVLAAAILRAHAFVLETAEDVE